MQKRTIAKAQPVRKEVSIDGSISARLGKLFREKRLAAGLTEADAAAYLESVSLRTYQLYESGEKSIPLSHIYALSNCLNVDPKVVFDIINGKSRKPKG